MFKKVFTCLAIVCLGVIVLAVLLVVVVMPFKVKSNTPTVANATATQTEPTPIPASKPTPASTSPTSPSGSAAQLRETNLPDLFNTSIPTPAVVPTQTVNLDLLLTTAKLAQANGWNGDEKTALPVALSDYPSGYLDALQAKATDLSRKITMPDSLAPYLTNSESQSAIQTEMLQARREYSDYLTKVGVSSRIRNQLDNITLPADASRYSYNPDFNPNAELSVTGPLNGTDRTKLKYRLVAVDVYLQMKRLAASGILGVTDISTITDPTLLKELRSLSIRVVSYHEFTHALQSAANVANAEPGLDDAIVWMEDNTGGIKFKWGGDVTAGPHNRDIGTELQADSVSFTVFSDVYHLSSVQRAQGLAHVYHGYLENGTRQYNEIMNLLETSYPHFNAWAYPEMVSDVMYRLMPGKNPGLTLIKELAKVDMGYFGGYLNFMSPAQVQQLWDFLKK